MTTTSTNGIVTPDLGEDANGPAAMLTMATSIDEAYGATVANIAALPVAGDFPGQRLYIEDIDEITEWNNTASRWQGHGVTFTPTWTNVTLGTTGLVNAGKYWVKNKLVTVKFDLTLGTGGAFTGTAGLDVPITAADAVLRGVGIAEMRDGGSGATLRGALIRQSSTTAVAFTSLDVAGANVTATVPWTWAATDTLAGTFTYEAA